MAGVRLTDEQVWDFVSAAHTGIMTTLRRDGSPITLPLWFAVVERTIYTRTRGRKLHRIANDPRASFLVETGNRWSELKAVHFSGLAEIVEPDQSLDAVIDAELKHKYARYRTPTSRMPAATAAHYARESRLVRFAPEGRVLSWDNANLMPD